MKKLLTLFVVFYNISSNHKRNRSERRLQMALIPPKKKTLNRETNWCFNVKRGETLSTFCVARAQKRERTQGEEFKLISRSFFFVCQHICSLFWYVLRFAFLPSSVKREQNFLSPQWFIFLLAPEISLLIPASTLASISLCHTHTHSPSHVC